MGLVVYNIFLLFLKAGIYTGSFFNKKAKLAVRGRKNILDDLRKAIPLNSQLIWMHCASLGEFEQGRPVIEELKKKYPDYKLLLTFFSPSGYEVQKNYAGADWIFYLPFDGARTAKEFLEITKPRLAIFVKYEYWYYYLKKIKYRKIPLLLISALFRKDMSFFKPYGSLQRKMLTRFDHVFVQNNSSKQLLDSIGISKNVSVAGDTRFDRVSVIAEKQEKVPAIEYFLNGKKALVAGSTWPEDESLLQKAINNLNNPDIKLVLAPHELSAAHIESLRGLFPGSVLYSELGPVNHYSVEKTVLIIDNYGLLSKLYRYAFITYVGGGFRKSGIHNVLEAAVFDKIVLFGPEYPKYYEAVELVRTGGAISFTNQDKNGRMLTELIQALISDEKEYRFRSKAAGDFVRSNRGATQKIVGYIQENRLLTN